MPECFNDRTLESLASALMLGEEALIGSVHKTLQKEWPNLLTLLVPRQAGRCAEVHQVRRYCNPDMLKGYGSQAITSDAYASGAATCDQAKLALSRVVAMQLILSGTSRHGAWICNLQEAVGAHASAAGWAAWPSS